MHLTYIEKILISIEDYLNKSKRKIFNLSSYKSFLSKSNETLLKEGNFMQVFRYLITIGCIKKEKDKNDTYSLTVKATAKNIKTRFKSINQKSAPLKKKWQMVIFDIPETERKKRDNFRNALVILGFKQYQKSIWICNHDYLKELKILIEATKIKPYIRVFFVEEIYKPV